MIDRASPTVTVVLPVHRQADHIGAILSAYQDALTGLGADVDLVCVVNGSPDGSAEACRTVADSRSGITVIEIDDRGWGNAVRRGIEAAEGDLIAYTNSARTSAKDLRTALALALLNAGSAVKAVRRARDNIVRRIGSVIFNLEARALFGLASWDINGTPKVFPRTFDALLRLEETGDLVDLEFLVTCQRQGYDLIEYPVTSTTRHGGSSTTGFASALRMYLGALALRRRAGGAPGEDRS